MRLNVSGLIAIGLLSQARISYGDDAADLVFFESKVRPLLISKCLECHGADKPKAGLRLDSREAILVGGESGPAVMMGKPDESLLVDVVNYRNSVQMPPKSKLSDQEIATLTDWVRRGLPWPNSKPSPSNMAESPTSPKDFTDEQKSFWAFQPVAHQQSPVGKDSAWVRSPIDGFILQALDAKGLKVSREASPHQLIRRVTLDLIGLPPTTEEVTEFDHETSPDKLERAVDRLLASPRYGERWARHWLDVARYADSNGLDENLAYANAFRYRDYVVKAMREDKPYDRFLIEQLAGDLLETPEMNTLEDGMVSPSTVGPESHDALIATGFLCLGAKMLAEDDPVKMQMDIIDEQVDTVSRAVMGLTMGCARCHDHKYDPLTTDDYYGLAGIFKSTQTMDTFTVVARWHERPLTTPQQEQHRNELQKQADSAKAAVERFKTEATEAILSEARQHATDYLIAATRELKMEEYLNSAKPRGNEPNPTAIPGSFLIEAEDYLRGNVHKDHETYGVGIGVLLNRGETPNFAEYEIDVVEGGIYQFELRYAAASSRPVTLSVNQKLVKSDAASRITGAWTPDSQGWFVECFVSLVAGRNLIRIEQPQYFPHIDKLLLTPLEISGPIRDNFDPGSSSENVTSATQLYPSFTKQWVKTLRDSLEDPQSILTAWNQFTRFQRLTPDSTKPENGVSRLLGTEQPSSLTDLATRYEKLFHEAQRVSTEVKIRSVESDVSKTTDPVLEAAWKLLKESNGPLKPPADIETIYNTEVKARFNVLREEQSRKEAAIPQYPETMAVLESKPENLRIHLRGSHLTLGREVPRQLPRILKPTASREVTRGSGRLELAQWLTSADHPLTARVMANRIWQWHFAHGLVRSPDNFGRLGERPSHPELLDWLAGDFSRRGQSEERNPRAWSIKAFHRRLIDSATYRQTTELNPDAVLVDPENRLLWRFHRQRMDVEVLRDSLLALSGLLEETPGGTLLPTANRSYVTSTANVNPAIYNSHRRSIYLPVVRSALYEVFTAFDFADPSTLAGQRDQTTVAPQALFMMNSAFVLDQARALARRLLLQNGASQEERIRSIYRLVYCRSSTEMEIRRSVAYVDQIRAALLHSGIDASECELRAWTSFCRALIAANEFVYVD